MATFSHLLSVNEVDEIVAKLGFDGQHYLAVLLQKYDTELDFTNDIRYIHVHVHIQVVRDLHIIKESRDGNGQQGWDSSVTHCTLSFRPHDTLH